jgi:hypothetical protein
VNRLSLSEAVVAGRLPDFIVQEEARGIGPIDRAEFDGAVSKLIKERQSGDRTSRSSSAGNSSGKRTRRDTDQDASN